MGKIGPKFSHLLTVRAEGAAPPPYGQPDRKKTGFFFDDRPKKNMQNQSHPVLLLLFVSFFRAIRSITDNWIALEEEDLSDEGGDEGEVSDLDEAGGNFSDNEVFELY